MKSKSLVATLLAVAVSGALASQASANLILNPGFETGDTTDWLPLNTGAGATITVQTGNGPSAPGTYDAYLFNTDEAYNLALQQSTALGDASPGLVNYSFDEKVDSSLNGGVLFIHIWDINSTGGVIDGGPGLLGPYFNTTWGTISGSFTAPANVDHLEIEFDSTTGAATGSAEAVEIDNVSLSQAVTTPEPASLSLVGLGLAGLVLRRRRR